MNDLRIFLSYSHQDEPIATAFYTLLQEAYGPALADVFFDKKSIAYGDNIATSISDRLDNADVLIAISAGAQPTGVLSWAGYEIGRFDSGWDSPGQRHSGRTRGDVIGRVAVLVNSNEVDLGPQAGRRAIFLGIAENLLSGPEPKPLQLRQLLAANNDLKSYLTTIELLLLQGNVYQQHLKDRQATLADLVIDFKIQAFRELRRRVRLVVKPSKQLLIRCQPSGDPGKGLPTNAQVFSVGQASEIFGITESNTILFKRAEIRNPGEERFETTWGEFLNSVKNHALGAYWSAVLTQAVTNAWTQGIESDTNLVLISSKGQRYRIVPTTITTFYDNDIEVSLYLIEALKRADHGDESTSLLLNGLNLVCRFRFAFLEKTSPYYWLNFRERIKQDNLRAVVRDMLMELDYLRSEATHANLAAPGTWEVFVVRQEELLQMISIWSDVESKLRMACAEALLISSQRDRAIELKTIAEPDSKISDLDSKIADFDSKIADLGSKITDLLKRMFEEVRSYNTLIGNGISTRLLGFFTKDSGPDSAASST